MERDGSSPGRGYTSRFYQQALDEGLLPNCKPGDFFLQDNPGVHAAKATKLFLEGHSVWALEHLLHFPDLNPIEHLWWALEEAMHQDYREFDILGDNQKQWGKLCTALQGVLLSIPDELIHRCIHSTMRRLEAVKIAHGY